MEIKKRSDEFPFYDNLTVDIKLNSGENGELIQKQIRGYQSSGTYKAEYLFIWNRNPRKWK